MKTWEKVKLLGNRVLVKQKEVEKRSRGGIVLPISGQEKPLEGIVVAVGEGVLWQIEEGARILFDNFAGTRIIIDEEPFLVMDADDIILIFNEKE